LSDWKNTEEVRQQYVDAMGPKLGELFHALSTELTWIHWRWKQYRVLFGEKPSRLDLLNEAAPFFFRLVQDVFFEDTLLGIARLVEPAKSAKKRNLSITCLPRLLSSSTLHAEVSRLVDVARSDSVFALDWRNRHLAHRDLNLVLQASAQPLAPASREQVEKALSSLRHVLNHVERELRQVTTFYASSPLIGDAEDLLYVIRDGLRRRQDRSACWDKGEFHEDDSRPLEEI
jgi:hypothetical protein